MPAFPAGSVLHVDIVNLFVTAGMIQIDTDTAFSCFDAKVKDDAMFTYVTRQPDVSY